jgi:uncharacterized protein (TIGR03435 family)
MKPSIVFAFFAAAGLAAAQPAFEVASIKPADPSPMNQIRVNMSTDAGMLRYTNVSLKQVIRVAYRVKDYQIDGPAWIDSEPRYNITAKLPAGSSEDQVPEMLQTLLAERFKLSLHRDTKDHAIYALVVAKGGPDLKPAEVPTGEGGPRQDGGAPSGGHVAAGGRGPVSGPGGRGIMALQMGPDGAHVKAASSTVSGMAELISRFTDRPIVYMTGIQGQYDFDFVLSPESLRSAPGMMMRGGGGPGGPEHGPAEAPADTGGSIYDAVQKYGLKLEPRKAPMEILVIDRLEKAPTEN